MSLTRRHYVLLAEALHSAKPSIHGLGDFEARWLQWSHDVDMLAHFLAMDNPRGFDKPRFIAACRENMDKEQTA